MSKLILILFFLISPMALIADEATTLFVKANQAYNNGEYEEAILIYANILDSGVHNWQVYYNLGNAYYRTDQLGRAILNYERAKKLNPENEDILFNLKFVQQFTVDRIPDPPKEAWFEYIERLFYAPGFMTILWITLSSYLLIMLLLILRFIKPEMQPVAGYRIGLSSLLAFFVLFGSITAARWYKNTTANYGVVQHQEVKVTSSPNDEATEVFVLHEGTKFQIQEQAGTWLRIRLRDGKTGWLPVSVVGKI